MLRATAFLKSFIRQSHKKSMISHGKQHRKVRNRLHSISILFLGLSAALLGRFVEKYGPRKAGTAAALFFGLGIGCSGLAILAKNIYALYLCYGILGGIGLGVGYIAPVSMLVKWFPDRRGLATGLAIMGFGFASLIAGPIIQKLIVTIGLPYTFFALGAGYFVIIFASSQYLSPPPAGWIPKGLQGGAVSAEKKIRDDLSQLNANEAVKTRRFYWLWLMLFINVTCGIAIISVASSTSELPPISPQENCPRLLFRTHIWDSLISRVPSPRA